MSVTSQSAALPTQPAQPSPPPVDDALLTQELASLLLRHGAAPDLGTASSTLAALPAETRLALLAAVRGTEPARARPPLHLESPSVQAALDLEASGDPEGAVAVLAGLWERDRSDGEVAFHLGRFARLRHDAAEARTWLQRAAQLRAAHPATLRETASLYLELGESAAAEELLARLRRLRPSDSWALRALGTVYSRTGRFELAVEVLDLYLYDRLDDREAHLELCRACLRLGRLDRVKTELELLGRGDGVDAAGSAILGEVELACGNVESAVGHLRRALDGGAADPNHRMMLAKALLERGDAAGAATALAPLAQPGPWSVLDGRARLALGDTRTALARAHEALEASAGDAAALVLRADALEAQGDLRGALGACQRLVETGKDEPALTMRIARLQEATGHTDEALAAVTQLLRLVPTDVGALRMAARLHEARSADRRALDLYARSLELDAKHAATHLSMSRIWLRHGRPRRALASAQEALALAPSNPDAALAAAGAFASVSLFEDAERHYRLALSLGCESPVAHRRLAELLTARGQFEEALGHGRVAAAAGEVDPALCLAMARAHHWSGQRDEASAWLDRGLALEAENAPLLELRALLALEAGEVGVAVEQATRALAVDACLAQARRVLGLALARSTRRPEAVEHLSFALSERPDDAAVRLELARCQVELGAAAQALSLYPEAASLSAEKETLGIMLGRAALRSGEAARAREILENLATRGCESLELFELLADAVSAAGDARGARAVLELACRKHPQAAGLFSRLSRVHEAAGETFDARRLLARALELSPSEPELSHQAASLELADNRPGDALRHVESFLKMSPRDPRAHFLRARIHQASGQPQAAEQSFRRALNLDPVHLDSCLALGRLLLRQGRAADARRTFEAFAAQSGARHQVLAELASVYLAEDRPREAEAYLRELVASGPEGRAGLLPLAELLLAQKRDREALQALEGGGSDGLAPMAELAESLRARGERRRARLLYERALALGAPSEQMLLGIARCHLESGEHAQARQRLEQLIHEVPGSAAAALELAKVLNAESLLNGPSASGSPLLARGLELLEKNPELLKTDPATLNLYAKMAARAGREAEASKAAARSLELDPRQAEVHALYGDLHLAAGRHAEALESYLKALALDPGLEEAACKAIAFLEATGHLVQARDVMELVVEKRPLSRRARLALARISGRLGEHQAAALHWEAAARDSRLSSDDAAGLAAAYLAMRRFADAERVNAAWLAADPKDLEALLMAGDIARAAGRLAEARLRYEQASRLHPCSARCPARLADLYHSDGRLQDGLLQVRRALELEPANPEHRLLHGKLLLEMNRTEAAREELERALAGGTAHDSEARLLLARAYRLLDDRRKAADTLQGLVDKGPVAGEALRELGSLYFEKGDWPRAVESLEHARAKGRGLDVPSLERLALCYARMGMSVKGAAVLRELAQRGEPAIEVVVEMSRCHARQNATRDALLLLAEHEGRRDTPARARVHLEMAALQYRLGDRKASQQNLLTALRLKPDDDAAQSQAAAFLEETQQFESMHRVFSEIVRRYPSDARALCHLGNACLRLSRPVQAQDAFGRAAKLDYNCFAAHAGLARACREAGDLPGAIEEYRKALFLQPRQARLTFELATVLAEHGLMDQARAAFQRVLELEAPGTALASAAREQLRKVR